MRLRGITFRFSLAVFLSITIMLVVASLYGYQVVRALLLQRIEEGAKHLTARTSNRIELVLNRCEKVAENMSDVMAIPTITSNEMEQLVHDVVLSNEEIFGSAVAFEPFAYSREEEFFCPYFYSIPGKPGEIGVKFLLPPDYDYLKKPWYTSPQQDLRPSWSEPYFDKGGGDIQMTTYSVPFFRANAFGQRVFSGVVTADLSLGWLQDLIDSIEIAHSGYAFIVDHHGNLITHPDPKRRLDTEIEAYPLSLRDASPQLARVLRGMTRGEIGFQRCSDPMHKERSGWIAFGPVFSTQWSIGVIFPEKEIFADIAELHREILAIFCIGTMLLLFVVVFIAHSVTRPILALADAANALAAGHLDVPVPQPRTKDEVATLAQAFEGMRTSLQAYIKNLAETTAAKERIQSELQIAHDIQMSILPKIFPPFPDRREFELHAFIQPAKAVGGDFYDFGILADNKLYFCIGDVSDKGVPASLFMAVIATLLKVSSQESLSPSGVLRKLNIQLCRGNDTCMFATIFFGILNIGTGELSYSSGGHLPPLHMRRNGEIKTLERTMGMAIGLEESVEFETKTALLEPGDELVLFTDGITEAMNATDELFGDNRLIEVVQCQPNTPADTLIAECLKKLSNHVGSAPQSDDITMLAIRYNGVVG